MSDDRQDLPPATDDGRTRHAAPPPTGRTRPARRRRAGRDGADRPDRPGSSRPSPDQTMPIDRSAGTAAGTRRPTGRRRSAAVVRAGRGALAPAG